MNVGRVIRSARTKRKMTQAELALKLGVVVSTVCEWECDDEEKGTNPRVDRLPAIAEALGIRLKDLLA